LQSPRERDVDYEPVHLGHRSEWFLLGTITKIVEVPIEGRFGSR
jgi:hypothetical protein